VCAEVLRVRELHSLPVLVGALLFLNTASSAQTGLHYL
jgi:hypothetical protein